MVRIEAMMLANRSLLFLVLIVSVAIVRADDPAPPAPTFEPWPFDAKEAKRRQEETAKAIGHPVTLETRLGDQDGPALQWRLIPAGTFMMGSPPDEPGHEGDERLHKETIADPYYMLETQLTVGQYQALLGHDPAGGADRKDPDIPAGMTYRDTVDHVLPALVAHAPQGWRVILPDQVRLEYAARAGVATMNPGGNQPEDAADYAWTRENSEGKVHAVRRKHANPWGLHDVIGNQWHWFWRLKGRYGDSSTDPHIVYGGSFYTAAKGNGARLANLQISTRPEGARFALIREHTPLPDGHPDNPKPNSKP